MIWSLLGAALVVAILLDGFEAMLMTRRLARGSRPSRVILRASWSTWKRAAVLVRPQKRSDAFLSAFGPLAMPGLFASWAMGLIVGFALIHYGLGSRLNPAGDAVTLGEYAYLSGVTFFTLGFGDLTAADSAGRALTVFEAGVGFAFLAIVISYLPVLYTEFARREVTISLMDARAGSPPTAAQLLARLGPDRDSGALTLMLAEWERWAAELLESHITYPILSLYRSQHDNQSWLAALAVILDTSALSMSALEGAPSYEARLTFAMARHAAVDLAQVMRARPSPGEPARLDPERWDQMRGLLARSGWEIREGDAYGRLDELRALYEPFLLAMGRYLMLGVPPVFDPSAPVDNWQTSAWMKRAAGLRDLADDPRDDHLDE